MEEMRKTHPCGERAGTYGFPATVKNNAHDGFSARETYSPFSSSPPPARNETSRERLTKGCRVLGVEYVMADRRGVVDARGKIGLTDGDRR